MGVCCSTVPMKHNFQCRKCIERTPSFARLCHFHSIRFDRNPACERRGWYKHSSLSLTRRCRASGVPSEKRSFNCLHTIRQCSPWEGGKWNASTWANNDAGWVKQVYYHHAPFTLRDTQNRPNVKERSIYFLSSTGVREPNENVCTSCSVWNSTPK